MIYGLAILVVLFAIHVVCAYYLDHLIWCRIEHIEAAIRDINRRLDGRPPPPPKEDVSDWGRRG